MMEGESNHECDLSESWSLIDINLNEESVLATDDFLHLKSERIIPSVFKVSESKKDENKHVEENEKEADIEIKDAETIENNDHVIVYKAPLHENVKKNINKETFDDDSRSDSCDAESIEILEMDENYRDVEIDQFDFSDFVKNDLNNICHLNNGGSLYKDNFEIQMLESDLLKRKLRKSNNFRDVKSSYSCESNEESESISCRSISHPVYKHYRNNVANSILSLTLGVIFAGVACIAIGHFLGVHDAGESVEELLKTLQKVQLENVALQSKLNQVNTGFAKKPIKSNSGQDQNEILNGNICEKKLNFEISQGGNSNLYLKSNPVVPSSEALMELLFKINSLLQKKSKYSSKIPEPDSKNMKASIYDQLAFLNLKIKNEPKVLENFETKIQIILQKLAKKLTSNQKNFEILYHKLVKLKDKLNNKLSKIFPDENDQKINKNFVEFTEGKRKITVAGQDIQSLQWTSEKNLKMLPSENFFVINTFPQPSAYYGCKKDNFWVKEGSGKNITIKEVNTINMHDSGVKENIHNKIRSDCSKKEKGHRKKNIEDNMMSKEKKRKKKEDKYNKINPIKGKILRGNKKKILKLETKDNTIFLNKKNRRVQKERKVKESKKFFHKDKPLRERRKERSKTKISISSFLKISKKNLLNSAQFYSGKRTSWGVKNFGASYGNLTGDWMFKWADGRKESRRSQSLGDWQFERAKGRKEQRVEDSRLNWQLQRASAREAERSGGYNQLRKVQSQSRKHFHESFSWI